MMFPKDRTVYASLNTSFTDFDELLLDLTSKHITGYVLVSFRGYDGVLFLTDGQVTAALEQRGDEKLTGPAAREAVAARAHEKGGLVNVYTLPPEIQRLLVRVLDGEPLYRDLTSSFTSLEKLVEKLGEDGHSGYVEVLFNDGRGGGMIFLESGRVAECVFAAENQNATGAEVLPTIVQAAASIGATFNVYRVSAGPAVATPGAAPEAPASAPAAEPEVDTLTLWSEIIAAIEEVVDGLSKPGRFAMTFKEVLVARAPTYPFLDPFAAEFEYSGQRVQFAGDPPNDFNRGLGDCLVDTVSRLAFQLKRADLETRIRERLADFPGRHSAVIEKFQLSDDIQEFVA